MRIIPFFTCLLLVFLLGCVNQRKVKLPESPIVIDDEFPALNLNYPLALKRLDQSIKFYKDDPFMLAVTKFQKTMILLEQGKFDESVQLLQDLDNLKGYLGELKPIQDIALSSYYQKRGRPDSSLYFIQKAERQFDSTSTPLDSFDLDILIFNQLGAAYFQAGAFVKAREYLNDALELLEIRYGTEIGARATLLVSMAFIYGRTGNNVRENEAINEAQRIMAKQSNVSPTPKALYYNQLSKHYLNNAEFILTLNPGMKPSEVPEAKLAMEKADEAQAKALLALENIPDNIFTAMLYSNNVELLLGKRKTSEAKKWIDKAEAIVIQEVGKENYLYAAMRLKKGLVSLVSLKNKEAREYFDECYAILHRMFPHGHPAKGMAKMYAGTSYLLPAMLFKKKDGIQKGLSYYDVAIQELTESQGLDPDEGFPVFEGVNDPMVLQEIMGYKGNLYFEYGWISSSPEQAMKQALPYYKAAAALSEEIIVDFPFVEEQEVALLSNLRHHIRIILALDSLYRMTGQHQYLEQAFYYSEKSKANRLLLKIRSEEFGEKSSVYTYLKSRLDKQAAELAKLESMLPIALNSRMRDSLKTEIFGVRQTYEKLLVDFQKDFPKLYSQMYAVKPLQLREVQAQLAPDQALLEFFIYEGIRVFVLTADTSFLVSHPYSDRRYLTKNMFDGIMGGVTDRYKESFTKYTQAAFEMYEVFFEAPLEMLGPEIKSLYLITDGGMTKFPSEILLTEKVEDPEVNYSPSHLSYLFEDYDISYGYSASTLFMNGERRKDRPKTYPYLAFAPSFNRYNTTVPVSSSRMNCGELSWNPLGGTDSLRILANSMKGKLFHHEKASLALFRKNISNSHILHLYTHGCLDKKDDLNSMLIFSDSVMRARDLYVMKTNADLVFLTACETAAGSRSTSEGVMGIANGFASAGCPSVVGSYWELPEDASLEITMNFFRYLRQGASKSQALGKAKLAYLKSLEADGATGDMLAPFNWAGMVLIGESN